MGGRDTDLKKNHLNSTSKTLLLKFHGLQRCLSHGRVTVTQVWCPPPWFKAPSLPGWSDTWGTQKLIRALPPSNGLASVLIGPDTYTGLKLWRCTRLSHPWPSRTIYNRRFCAHLATPSEPSRLRLRLGLSLVPLNSWNVRTTVCWGFYNLR